MATLGTYCGKNVGIGSIAALILLLAAVSSFGQLPTGTILGVVTDASGGVVAGASVTATNLDTGQARTAKTGGDGAYRLPSLPVGNYQLEVSHEGFQTETRKGLTLTVTQEAVVNLILQVGSATQSVTVTEQAPLVDTTSSTLGGLVNEQRIEDLPLNGRNYMALSLLQPGIGNLTTQQGHISGITGIVYSSNGAPTRSNNYMLDGAIMQNLYGLNPSSITDTTLGVDGIREYRVITNLFSAEFGMAMGSQTTIVSKGGTNQFHGDVFEFMRNSVLDARNYFDVAPSIIGHRLPEFRRNQFGGSGGGPIKRDKTFFYGVFEGIRQTLGITNPINTLDAGCHPPGANASNGYGAGATIATAQCPEIGGGSVTLSPVTAPLLTLLPLPNVPGTGTNGVQGQFTFPATQSTKESFGQMRVDQNFSSTDSFFVRYTIDDAQQTQPRTFPVFNDRLSSRSQYLTLAETHIFSANVVNTFRTSFSRTNYTTNSTSTISGPPFSFVTGESLGSLAIPGLLPFVGTLGFGPDVSPGYHRQNILTFSDDVNWIRGRHAIKFGVLINRYQLGIDENFFRKGLVAYVSAATFLQAQYVQLDYTPASANTNRYFQFKTFGFYGEDDFRATNRLTVNLGLRYEFNTTPRERRGREAAFRNFATDTAPTPGPVIANYSLKDFSPRIGFAWDVFGNGKMSVRGGGGIYYDISGIGSALTQETTGTPPWAYQVGNLCPPPFCATTLPLDVSFPASALLRNHFEGAILSTVLYHAKQPYMGQYNLSIERQLPGNMALNVAYVGSRGIHLWSVEEGNPNVPDQFLDPQNTNPGGSRTTVAPFLPNTPGGLSWSCQIQFPPSDPRFNACRINPFFGDNTIIETVGDSWYNSLQVELTKRVTRGLEFQSAFTRGKSLDTGSGQQPASDPGTVSVADPFFPHTDKGPSEWDTAVNWQFNLLYHFPTIRSGGFASKLVNGWWMGNIASIQSGYAFSPLLTFIQSNSNINQVDRPDIVTPQNVAAVRNGSYTRDGILGGNNPNAVPFNANAVNTGGTGTNGALPWFNNNMFIPGPPGLLGNAGRGMLRGPRLVNWDFSLAKNTKLGFLGEGGNLEFRAEFFNIINRANFSLPDNSTYVAGPTVTGPDPVHNVTQGTVASASTGQITSTATPAREIQFGLKLEF
jgi:hypothetical protein